MSSVLENLRRGRSLALLVMGNVFLTAGAAAQDREECFSKLTRYNVCEKAREMQRTVAPSLPMKMNANITMSTIAVDGPRVIITAIWHTKKSDVDSSLRAGGISLAELDTRMSQATRNSVCGEATMAAFIRLGGQVQYAYKTEDGHILLKPVVTAC